MGWGGGSIIHLWDGFITIITIANAADCNELKKCRGTHVPVSLRKCTGSGT
jgi:hypothetical protein